LKDYVHKMLCRRSEDGRYDIRVNKAPFDVSTRFDDIPGIPSLKINADFNAISAFLKESGPTGSIGRLREAATGQECEIVFPADEAITERIAVFFAE